MMDDINIDNVIRIETMPKVFYQLEIIGNELNKTLKDIESFECDEQTKQDIKKTKANITKFKNLMEDKRKTIKKELLKDYEVFNEKYENEIKNKLINTEQILNEKIKNVEYEQIKEKTSILFDFYKEWVEYYHLEGIVPFERIPIKITLSASEKSLKEQIKTFLEKVSFDMECISSEEFRSEVLYEYVNNGYDYTKAKLKVKERLETMQSVSTWQDNMAEKVKVEEEIIEKVDEIVKPIVIETQEITIKFTLMREEIRELNEFLKEHNFEYEILE